jgi:acetyltransferase-like isoleucine patch superfamily enzyme
VVAEPVNASAHDHLDAQVHARILMSKWRRDEHLALRARLTRAAAYLYDIGRAQLYLRSATEVPFDVRSVGRPIVRNRGVLTIGAECTLRSIVAPVEITVDEGATLIIGRSTHINSGTTICVTSSVRIGERVEIAPFVSIYDTNFHDLHDRTVAPPSRPVVIDDDAWLCAKCTILPGVHIGRGTVVMGVPAAPVRQLDPGRLVVRTLRSS